LAEDHDFFVRFWGVRGSIACPGAKTMRYGGNTSCLEIGCGDRMLIFDAGTGLYALGSELAANRGIVGGGIKYDLFFTHTHFDHICGFPFFQPAFDPSNQLRIWAGHLLPERTIREVLIYLMMNSLFPIPIDTMRAKLEFEDFEAGKSCRRAMTFRFAPRRSIIPMARPAIALSTVAGQFAMLPTLSMWWASPTRTFSV
jgi:phosphoribosyl 1,2-cyclic phosphodiesterase